MFKRWNQWYEKVNYISTGSFVHKLSCCMNWFKNYTKIMLTLAFPSKVSHIKILAENRDSNLKERVQWWLSWWFLILQVIRMYKLYCLAKFFVVPDSLETVESDLWKPVVGVEGSFKDKESFLLGVLPKLQKNREITLIVKSWNTTCYIKSRPFEMHVQCRYEIYTKASRSNIHRNYGSTCSQNSMLTLLLERVQH